MSWALAIIGVANFLFVFFVLIRIDEHEAFIVRSELRFEALLKGHVDTIEETHATHATVVARGAQGHIR